MADRSALRGGVRKPGDMLPGSRRGPKSKQWTKAMQETFVNFFAKRSEPLNPAEMVTAPLVEATGAGLSWLSSPLSARSWRRCGPVAGAISHSHHQRHQCLMSPQAMGG